MSTGPSKAYLGSTSAAVLADHIRIYYQGADYSIHESNNHASKEASTVRYDDRVIARGGRINTPIAAVYDKDHKMILVFYIDKENVIQEARIDIGHHDKVAITSLGIKTAVNTGFLYAVGPTPSGSIRVGYQAGPADAFGKVFEQKFSQGKGWSREEVKFHQQ